MKNLIIFTILLLIGLQIEYSHGQCASVTQCKSCLNDPAQCDDFQCNSLYGKNAAGKCEICSNQAGCYNCTVMTSCTRCLNRYQAPISGSAGCGNCSTNCAQCSVAGGCDRCNNGFYFDGTVCAACADPNCAVCNSTTCSNCKPGYSFIGGTCTKCADNCRFCSTAGTCNPGQCFTKYGYVSGASQECQLCSASNCDQCDTTTPSSGQCDRCSASYTLQADKTCKHICNTVPDCENCLAVSTRCTTCRVTFGVDPDGQCQPCSNKANCARCDNTTLCTQCTDITKFGPMKNGSGECGLCAPNCLECTNNGFAKCDVCASGYGLQADATCLACSTPNCSVCDGSGSCTRCLDGFRLNASISTCQACAPHCSFCNTNGPGKCDPAYCGPPHLYDSATKTCIAPATTAPPRTTAAIVTTTQPILTTIGQCITIPDCIDCHLNDAQCIQCDTARLYGLTSDGLCEPCNAPAGCFKCQNISQCTVCASSDHTGPLMDGSGGCGPCSSNCLACPTNGANKCDQCNDGYFLNSSNQCEGCSTEHCAVCNYTVCTRCVAGYVLSNGACANCSAHCGFCSVPGKCDSRSCLDGYKYNNTSQTCIDPNATTTATSVTTKMLTTAAVLNGTSGPTVSFTLSNTTQIPQVNTTGTTAANQQTSANTTANILGTTPPNNQTVGNSISGVWVTTPLNDQTVGNSTSGLWVTIPLNNQTVGNSTSGLWVTIPFSNQTVIPGNSTTSGLVQENITTTRGAIQENVTTPAQELITTTSGRTAEETSRPTANVETTTGQGIVSTRPTQEVTTSEAAPTTTGGHASTGVLVGGIVGGLVGGVILVCMAASALSSMFGSAATAGSAGVAGLAGGQLSSAALSGLQFSRAPAYSGSQIVRQLPTRFLRPQYLYPRPQTAYRYAPNYRRGQPTLGGYMPML